MKFRNRSGSFIFSWLFENSKLSFSKTYHTYRKIKIISTQISSWSILKETTCLFSFLLASLESNQARRQRVLELFEKTRRTLRSKWDRGGDETQKSQGRGVNRRVSRARGSPEGSGRGGRGRSHVPSPFSTVYRYVRCNVAPAQAAPTCCCPARAALTHWRHAVSNSRPPATDNSTCLKGSSDVYSPRRAYTSWKHASRVLRSWIVANQPRMRINAFDFCAIEPGYFYSIRRGQLMDYKSSGCSIVDRISISNIFGIAKFWKFWTEKIEKGFWVVPKN